MEAPQLPQIELPRPMPTGEKNEISVGPVSKVESLPVAEKSLKPNDPHLTASQAASPAVTDSKPKTKTKSDAVDAPTISSAPAVADDVDVIEKEWVKKAREIVHKTKDDPFRQNKDLNTFKADYMKKRYGKDIKVASE